MSQQGEWIANCLPDRVDRISAASVYLLKTGPPRPNQLQTMDDLVSRGLVGLYRVGKKDTEQVRNGQRAYLEQSPFAPTPGVLKSYIGPAAMEEPTNTS